MLRHYISILLFLSLLSLDSQEVPRVVIGLYDSQFQRRVEYLNLHQFAEMPLNHLGLKIEYHDIQQGLPSIKERPDVIGVLTWFPYSATIEHPQEFIDWSIEAIEAGKKYVVLGNPGFNTKAGDTPKNLTNRFWKKLGLRDADFDIAETYTTQVIYTNPELLPFERDYSGIKSGYPLMEVISKDAVPHLIVGLENDPKTKSNLIVTSPNGGYVAEEYAAYKPIPTPSLGIIRKWYVNPFKFFALAFGTDGLPKPDTTTLAGSRIYYSHIDGDGWNNVTELEEYRQNKTLSSEVILREIILNYPDLPLTVGPIAADIDLNWFGLEAGREIAQKIFALPHIEVGCHTFTHPFDWGFFENYNPDYETRYLSNFTTPVWKNRNFFKVIKDSIVGTKIKILDADSSVNDEGGFQHTPDMLDPGYETPRAYALKPFNLHLEVFGAIKEVQALAPHGKNVKLYQWSGNAEPFAEAVLFTEEANVNNLNGGNTRFDPSSDSYAWVSPLGMQKKHTTQIYSSMTNENLYTDMWTKAFYGFNQLPITYQRTESPLRIKPMNLYYHMYSGEKLPSLDAVKENLEFIRSEETVPIPASHFCEIVRGFYDTKMDVLSNRRWLVKNRGALQTIRFDRATFLGVDFAKSRGVIGQRHHQGSLYIYLDEKEPFPIIALKDLDRAHDEPVEKIPYLVKSHWKVWNVTRGNEIGMQAQGFGKGAMEWRVPSDGMYKIAFTSSLRKGAVVKEARGGILAFDIDTLALDPINIVIGKSEQ